MEDRPSLPPNLPPGLAMEQIGEIRRKVYVSGRGARTLLGNRAFSSLLDRSQQMSLSCSLKLTNEQLGNTCFAGRERHQAMDETLELDRVPVVISDFNAGKATGRK
jgi:hypothetical protein